jgi:plasmid stability protein
MRYDDGEGAMASLQIRELPDDVYEALARRARAEGRSLAQQAVVELKRLPGRDARERRRETVERLLGKLDASRGRDLQPTPEALIREDRER